MILIVLLCFVLLLAIFFQRTGAWRGSFLAASVAWATLLTAGTEILSLFRQITAPAVLVFWLTVDAALLIIYSRLPKRIPWQLRARWDSLARSSRILLLLMGAITALVGVNALLAPPNSWDTLAWGLPRVMQWIQQRNVAHFQTSYEIQLDSGPWSAFAMLHLQLLAGSDQFANLVQWFSLIGSAIGASLIAAQLGGSLREQVAAAAIALSIPMGIAEASGSLNDYVVAFWVVCYVFYLLRLRERTIWPNVVGAGLCLALAVSTKVTAVVCVAPFLLWGAVFGFRRLRWRLWKPVVVMAALALLFNAGPFVRNIAVFGGPFGAARRYGQMNELFSPAAIASNVIRNLSLQFATPFSGVNAGIDQAVRSLHQVIGIDVNDPRTTYLAPNPLWLYQIPSDVINDANAGNPAQLLLFLAALVIAVVYRPARRSGVATYTLVTAASFLLFFILLKWTTSNDRYLLAYFVLFAPAIAVCLATITIKGLVEVIAGVLLFLSLPWAMFNTVRPLLPLPHDMRRGAVTGVTVFDTPRDDLYFKWVPSLMPPYRAMADFVQSTGCSDVGLLEDGGVLEYPVWQLLNRGESQSIQIRHINVTNESASLAEPDWRPCAVIYIGDLAYDHLTSRYIHDQGITVTIQGRDIPYTLALKPPDALSYQFGVYVPQ